MTIDLRGLVGLVAVTVAVHQLFGPWALLATGLLFLITTSTT